MSDLIMLLQLPTRLNSSFSGVTAWACDLPQIFLDRPKAKGGVPKPCDAHDNCVFGAAPLGRLG